MGYGDVDDAIGDVRDRWREEPAAALRKALEADPAVAQWRDGPRRRRFATAVVYRHVPASLYLDFVEIAIDQYVDNRRYVEVEYADVVEDPYVAPGAFLNELFAARGIEYRFTERGRAEWHGDEGVYDEVVRPALDALADGRLDGPREEFEAGLRHLRRGTPKDREDAIEEAGKSVESAMKVLLAGHGVERVGNETAEPLWNLLRENEIVPPKTKDAILSTSRLRNEYGAHGQGIEVREIPTGIPELAVSTAAASIAYLAGLLP
ncbi:MAG: hypothetical protein ACRELC_07410 [Gemmatimonadota bacterium]